MVTPDTLSSSRSLNPSTSKPALMSTLELKVERPDTLKVVNVAPAPGTATPLIPVYLAPLT